MISVRDLTKKYSGKVVLDLPALDIPQGQRFGLVGNNGAGKTTLITQLTGMIPTTSGDARFTQ